MGTRLALGATSNGLLYLVLKQTMFKAAVGGAIGVVLVFASAPLLHKLDLRSLADDPAISLAQLTGKINLLCASTGPSSYATFFYARLDETTRCLTYVNGGHNPPFLLRNHQAGNIEELSIGGMIVGMFPFSQYEEGVVQLEPGDVLMLRSTMTLRLY